MTTTTESEAEAGRDVIRRAVPHAADLVEAVANEDKAAVDDILKALDRQSLYALAIVLAGQLLPAEDPGDEE